MDEKTKQYIKLSEKWEDYVGYRLAWNQVVVCEILSDPERSRKYLPKEIQPLGSHINAFTGILELSNLTGECQRLENENSERIAISPDWSEGRKLFAKELEGEFYFNRLPDNDTPSFIEWVAEPFIRERVTLKQKVYRDVMSGKGNRILDYSDFLYPYLKDLFYEGSDLYSEFFQTLVTDIARSTAIAQILPILKHDGSEFKERPELSRRDNLKWIGTQGELGAIVDKLMEQGYIEENQEASKSARMSIASFSFPGNSPLITSLRQCFKSGSDKANLLRLLIPPSSNKGK